MTISFQIPTSCKDILFCLFSAGSRGGGGSRGMFRGRGGMRGRGGSFPPRH